MQTRSPATRRVSDQATGLRLSVSRTTSPLRGTRYASSFSVPSASTPDGEGARPAYETFPFGERRLPLDVGRKPNPKRTQSQVVHRAHRHPTSPPWNLT